MAKTESQIPANPKLAVPIVLFGVDDSGKPKAARFAKEQADLAIKAAGQLQLRTLAITGPDLVEVARRLPIGRIHGSGRNVVPSVSHDIYDKLLALSEAAATGAQPPSPAEVKLALQQQQQQHSPKTTTCRVTGTRSAEAIS